MVETVLGVTMKKNAWSGAVPKHSVGGMRAKVDRQRSSSVRSGKTGSNALVVALKPPSMWVYPLVRNTTFDASSHGTGNAARSLGQKSWITWCRRLAWYPSLK